MAKMMTMKKRWLRRKLRIHPRDAEGKIQ